MDGFNVDIFATKGDEYLLVIGFLLAFVGFWYWLNRSGTKTAASASSRHASPHREWFAIPEDRYYHRGHTWVRPEDGEVVSIGLDDFAQKLVGTPDRLDLPEVGSRVEQGRCDLQIGIDEKSIDVLSPVDGEVVDRNSEVLRSPDLLNLDPYGDGWLVKIRAPRLAGNLGRLLWGRPARRWMDATELSLREQISGELGMVLQDGGFLASGIAKNLSPEDWDKVAGEFLLTRPDS